MADTAFPQTLLETQDAEDEEQEGSGVITPDVLREILASSKRDTAELINATIGRRAERGVPLQRDNIVPEINLSLEGLPDPQVVGAAAFHTEYMKRVNKSAGEFATTVREQTRREAASLISDQKVKDKVESLILKEMPDLNQDVLGQAARVVAGRYHAQGHDPMAELRARPEEIAQEIVDYIGDMAASLGAPRRQVEEDEGVDRTAGLVPSRGRIRTHRAERKERLSERDRPDPKSMYNELTKLQREARIY